MSPSTPPHPSAGELGAFLRTRRARLDPRAVGITSYGTRRVPGLRREELAQLAGVSPTYYTRLEQGQSANASVDVIEALARALELDEDERAHLHELARPTRTRRRRPARTENAAPSVVRLIQAMAPVPAIVMGRRNDVLAWNRLGHALVAGHCDHDAPDHLGQRPNLTRMLFLDAHTRDLYPRWDEEASRAVASLRLIAGRYPEDAELAELVGELMLKSEDFARLWSMHPVQNCVNGRKLLLHPQVGELDLEFEVLHLADASGHRIITYTAEPGSPSDTALWLLGSITASPTPFSSRPAPVR